MSQVDLAAASGVADSYVSRLEKGDRMPSIDVIFRIAGALGIQVETLVKDLKLEFSKITRSPANPKDMDKMKPPNKRIDAVD